MSKAQIFAMPHNVTGKSSDSPITVVACGRWLSYHIVELPHGYQLICFSYSCHSSIYYFEFNDSRLVVNIMELSRSGGKAYIVQSGVIVKVLLCVYHILRYN